MMARNSVSNQLVQYSVFYTCLVTTIIVGQKSGHLVPPEAVNLNAASQQNNDSLEPTVFIAILARNKAHTLPYFLTLIDRLDYPKERIAIWYELSENHDYSIDSGY